jgi:zinc protease
MLLVSLLFSGASWAARAGGGDGTVLRATLDNGLRVVIVRNALAPVVTTEVNYLVGSNEAPKGFPGTAHAQEHMMFRGSPGLSAGQLADITAAMGGMFDADTRQTVTQYFFTVPADDLDMALHIQSLRMRGVLDSENLWDHERKAIEQEVAQDLSSPQYVLYTRLLKAAFHGTPYAHDALGTKPSFDKTTGAMLKQFYDRWYAPNNAILVVVGDIKPAATLRRIKQLFGPIPKKRTPQRPAVHLQPMVPQTLHTKTDLPYGMAVVALRMPGYRSPDYAAAQVLADVLDSHRGKLYDLVPEGKALDSGFSFQALPDAGLGYATAAFPRGGHGARLVKRLRAILAHVARHGVSPDLVAAAKRAELASAQFQKNSISGLASAWSQALAVEGRASPDADAQAIQHVTVADVNRAAKKYLDLDHAIVAVVTPQPSGKPISSKGFGGKESFAPEKTTAVKLPAWARAAVKRVSVPRSTLQPKEFHLANGIRLIVQPESISDTVSVYGHIRNRPELETPPRQEGVDEVLAQLFSYGTHKLDRLAFQKALDDIGANESAGTDFSLQVLSSHFRRGMQLLAANELHPALPDHAFRVVRKQVSETVAGRLQSPGYQVGHSLKRDLFPHHDPTLRHATAASVAALSRADVRRYFRNVFRPDLTTIVVVGKVTPHHARAVIEHYFGHWKADGPKPETLLPPVPPNRPATTVVPNPSRVQDKVMLAETLGLNRLNPDYYALQLGNHVLGGGFYATRLYRDLRENGGLVYYVASDFEVGRTRAVYFVSYACNPPNVSKARAIIERDLHRMQTTPVSARELRQAKALVLREIPLSQSSVDAIASGYLHRARLGLPLDEPTRAAHRYAALTAKQVQQAFAKWLRVGDLVQVSEGPAPQ